MTYNTSHALRGTLLGAAVILVTTVGLAPVARAAETAKSAEATYADIKKTMGGGVPTFVKLFPKAGIAGAWAEERDLEMSDKTALDPKTKALISLAVSAQIPCRYCIWLDTKTAKENGASQEEIAEAVAMSALTRHWSTFFNGMQLNFEDFKKEFGGEASDK